MGEDRVAGDAPALTPALARGGVELWAGVECSVVRTANGLRDQVRETGHYDRLTDLDAIAALGVRRLRYPVLFETVSPDNIEDCDWRWHDERLARLRDLGIEVIAGLIHHGGGPAYTSLVDPAFPDLLARHAARVAERYPWVRAFTPINEPGTTARFSGLYGLWHPFGHDTATLLRTLVTECRATVAAMKAIRAIRPNAELIQSEDIGRIFATPPLAYQADYENGRRWLSLDLLTGRVGPDHPWHKVLVEHGIDASELAALHAAPCPPDVIGVNYYLTSDRFLDHRTGRYPAHFVGGNGRDRYADVEAVRADIPDDRSAAARLREAWDRYGLPVAITEVHNGCTREEQLRWLVEVWSDAVTLRQVGVDVRAVTLWSLFGAVDWNSLLTRHDGHFETGVFDTRGGKARPTILARAATALASYGTYAHPILARRGWWRRHAPATSSGAVVSIRAATSRPVLITGASGTLGQAFARLCTVRGLSHVVTSRAEMDIADEASVQAAVARHRPWAIINAAGFVRVAEAEREADRCNRENVTGAATLARAARRAGLPFVAISSDLVFGAGTRGTYVESDTVAPAGAYGTSKAEAERRVVAEHPAALIVRTSAFFGPWDRHNFVYGALQALAAGAPFGASDNTVVSPTYVPHLVHAILDLLIDAETGVWHLTNRGSVSWAEFARTAAREAGLSPEAIAVENGEARSTVLTSERGVVLPPLDAAIAEYVRDCTLDWRATRAPRAGGLR